MDYKHRTKHAPICKCFSSVYWRAKKLRHNQLQRVFRFFCVCILITCTKRLSTGLIQAAVTKTPLYVPALERLQSVLENLTFTRVGKEPFLVYALVDRSTIGLGINLALSLSRQGYSHINLLAIDEHAASMARSAHITTAVLSETVALARKQKSMKEEFL